MQASFPNAAVISYSISTMVFMCGLYFMLRNEKRNSNLTTDQLELVEPPDGVPDLTYAENMSKTNQKCCTIGRLKPRS